MRKMRELARINLYFKGFPTDDGASIPDLNAELKTFFARFGEVKTLSLPAKNNKDGSQQQLLGFGFVSFETLESAQKCRYDSAKDMFRSVYKIQAYPFEWRELRSAHKMEQIDQKEL